MHLHQKQGPVIDKGTKYCAHLYAIGFVTFPILNLSAFFTSTPHALCAATSSDGISSVLFCAFVVANSPLVPRLGHGDKLYTARARDDAVQRWRGWHWSHPRLHRARGR